MKIILATGNHGKIREIESLLGDFEIVAYKDILEPFEIVEDGDSFAKNALIKAKAIYQKLPESEKNSIVLSDDSGISVPALGGEPGIFSARYAGNNVSDNDNLNRLVKELKSLGVDSARAYYTASIALIAPFGEWVAHGWMYGRVITSPKGNGGFGYDPMFIPDGFDKTLGDLSSQIKSKISHRTKALNNIKPVLLMIKNRLKRGRI